jgi:ribosomal protein S18 acetylase RimI-like enzyme
MNLNPRPYQTEEDYWRMRAFLRQVFLLNRRRQICWHVARLDYCRFHVYLNCSGQRLEESATLWETGQGEMAAFLLPEGPGEAHLQIHPAWRSPELEEEMLETAERRLASTQAAAQADGTRKLCAWAPGEDTALQGVLARRGYTPLEGAETQHTRLLDAPIPPPSLPAGYSLRSLGDGLELLERCYASGLGFHEGDIQVAVENRRDPTWYRNIQSAPLYRRDLDIVAIDPQGAIAAFCTVWYDDATRSGYFEPVATVPEHQRRGLGRAVLNEGLRRLQRMGGLVAMVGGYSAAANGLYAAAFGSQQERYAPWQKQF